MVDTVGSMSIMNKPDESLKNIKLIIIRHWKNNHRKNDSDPEFLHHPVLHKVLGITENRTMGSSREQIEVALRNVADHEIKEFKKQFPEFKGADFHVYIMDNLPESFIF